MEYNELMLQINKILKKIMSLYSYEKECVESLLFIDILYSIRFYSIHSFILRFLFIFIPSIR